MLGTMQDYPLTLTMLFKHGAKIHAGSEVISFLGDRSVRATFAEVAARTARLASALQQLGIRSGDRIGTLCWNHQQTLETYFAIPCMGAVNHTLNLRLFPEQLAYIINHAQDRMIIVDESLIPVLAKVIPELKTVERHIVIGNDNSSLAGSLKYEELLASGDPDFEWPEVDERSASSMCYTSGTTGHPKGVAYTHRSNFLHSMAVCQASTLAVCEQDRLLMIPPMFHANAWGLPYAAWMSGADVIMPGRYLQGEPLCRLITAERPTLAGAVPTVLNDILRYADAHPVDFSSLRMIMSGGSAVPRALIEAFEQRFGVKVIQAWGMTETSPLSALALPPKGTPPDVAMNYRAKTGRLVAGVEMRLAIGERILPWDGKSVGEIEVRGPWITGSYFGDDSGDRFHDGWLRTGDVGSIDPLGYVQITDRAKDVIKSGGEWISSVDLEGHLMAHPDVIEAAVIGVADERWDERPLACIVLRNGSRITIDELRAFLSSRVAKWWLPERWAFLEDIPKTSVGKFDKKVLRARYRDGGLAATPSSVGATATPMP
jgi:acyl-CoA synthetase (AMP-forming)/AMP-acid ligase II